LFPLKIAIAPLEPREAHYLLLLALSTFSLRTRSFIYLFCPKESVFTNEII